MLGIYAERENPQYYGFDYEAKDFDSIIKKIMSYEIIVNQYIGIQKALRKNYKYHQVIKSARWLYRKNFMPDEWFHIELKNKKGEYTLKEEIYMYSPNFIKKLYDKIKNV